MNPGSFSRHGARQQQCMGHCEWDSASVDRKVVMRLFSVSDLERSWSAAVVFG